MNDNNKVSFKVEYSVDKDIENYLKTIWKYERREDGRENHREKLLSRYAPEIREAINKASTKEEAEKVIRDYLESRSIWFKNNTELILKGMEYVLNQRSEEIINELEKLFNKNFPYKEITVYVTTVGLCPYYIKEHWFMINRNSSLEDCIRTAKHELNHFMFHHYYDDLSMRLGEDKFYLLKEAMVYLNGSEDRYRPAIVPLGEYIRSISDKPIGEIVDLAIKFIDKS